MDSMELLPILRQIYEGYLLEHRQRPARSGLLRFLSTETPPEEQQANAAFLCAVERTVASLNAARDASLAAQAVRYMLLEARGPDQASQLMVEATQPLAIPLLERLSVADAAAILTEYRARYPRKKLLAPRQQELMTALEARANG